MIIVIAVICFQLIDLECALHGDEIDDYVQAVMKFRRIPGLAIAVVKDSEIVKMQGYGLANLEAQKPVSAETQFQLASCTKQFTAAAIMHLVQNETLSVRDSLGTLIPDCPSSWSAITVHDLLTHTSGISEALTDPKLYRVENPTGRNNEEEWLGWLFDHEPTHEPGQIHRYNNANYVLLSMIIDRVSNLPYDQYIRQHVLGSLGMTNTMLENGDGEPSNLATQYDRSFGTFATSRKLDPFLWNRGDGGFVSSANDLAIWMCALDTDNSLSDESKNAMWTQVALDSGRRANYGYGWGVYNALGRTWVQHNGARPGAAASLFRFPADRISIIVLANCGHAYTETIAISLAHRLGIAQFAEQPWTVSDELLETYSGYYDVYGDRLLTIESLNRSLFVSDGGAIANEFIPISHTELRATDSDRTISFEPTREASNESASLRLGHENKSVHRIGPLIAQVGSTGTQNTETNPRTVELLRAISQGKESVSRLDFLAEQSKAVFMKVAPLHSVPDDFQLNGFHEVHEADVAGRGIRRHGSEVTSVRYLVDGSPLSNLAVLVYLSREDRIVDFDIVDAGD